MSPVPIVFAHGLEGAPQGTKIAAMQAAGLQVIAPDGRGKLLAERIDDLERATRAGGVVLGGSSYGGLAAAWLAALHPERFCGLLLCAPALHLIEAPVMDPQALVAPSSLPTILLHGRADSVVPIRLSQQYQQRSGPHVVLRELDDDHRLAGSIPALIEAARSLLGASLSG
jgi:pimeloyl-ACP methyl ester carboxylesterase